MSKLARWVAVALGCCVAATGAGLGFGLSQEQEERREERRVERDADREAPKARRAKSVIGSKVSIRGDIAIGTVDDIIFADDGYIDYLVVINEGKKVLIPWEAAKFSFEERTAKATVDVTQERFREAPVVDRDDWTMVYEPTYRRRVFSFYGLTPRAERRVFIRRP